MPDFFGLALRISVTYLYALLIMRLSGKRSLATLTPLDFVIGLIIGDMFDDIIWATIPVAQGLVGLTTVVVLHTLVALAATRSRRVHDLVCSTPTPVIEQGQWLPAGLSRERTPAEEVRMELRLLGEDKLEEIEAGCWEPNGEISVKKTPAARPAQKRDLAALREAR